MAEEEVVLKYHDVAVFKNQELDGPQKEIADRKMISYLHSFLNNQAEKGGTRFLPNEIVKTPGDVKIIEAVIRMVAEQMVSLKREKIIEIPLPFVHLVPEGANCESNPVFGGIVVERSADDVIFAVKLFQKVFCRMSYSAVKVCDQRQIVCIDVGNSFKEAVASLKSREFLEKAMEKGLLKKVPIIEEKLFDLKSEMVFMRELDDLWERNRRLFPKERFSRDMVEATINGRILPLMVLRDRRVDLEEAQKILFWINGAGARMF
ncbi:MAG: hypothetical protein PHH21_03055 [Candidatus Pacebacteria bacterium]|nr:hypothetical protein [Candidatus Paceibacterota bacterium]